MVIGNGKLFINGVQFQLYRADGQPATLDHSGHGVQVTRNGVTYVVLGNPNTDVQLPEYRMANEPTAESVRFRDGYSYGATQKRERCGSTWDSEFAQGWYMAWCDKRAGRQLNPEMVCSTQRVHKAA